MVPMRNTFVHLLCKGSAENMYTDVYLGCRQMAVVQRRSWGWVGFPGG